MPKGRLFWAKSARRRPSPTKTDFKQVHWCVLFIYASVRRHKYVKFKTETTNINWLEHFLFSCEFPLLYQNWWQMFLLVSVRHVGTHPGGNQHGVSIQIAINLGKTFLRISRIRNILLAWILARVCIFTSFHFPDSGLYNLNGFDFDFHLFWMAWHWKPAISVHVRFDVLLARL